MHIGKAIFFTLCYGVFVAALTVFAKLAVPTTTHSMTVFARFAVSIAYVMVIFAVQRRRGNAFTLTTKHFGMHFLRSSTACLCQFALFYSLSYIPLIDANLLFMTYPLFVAILMAIFFSAAANKANKKSWFAIVLGFVGVALILKPGHEVLHIASLVGLSSGLLAAISILGIHELGKTESAYTIMFYYFSLAFVISGAVALLNWHTPDLHTALLLGGVGVFGALSQECSTRALICAPAKVAAPLMYSTIVFSGVADWLVWHHVPGMLSLLGALAIFAGNTLNVVWAKKGAQKSE